MIALMNTKYLNVKLYFWLLFLASSLIFVFFPQIDIYTTSLFYDGKSFPLNKTWVEGFFYYSVKPLIIIFALSSIGIFLYNTIKKKHLLILTLK